MSKIKPFNAGGYFPIHNWVFDVAMPQLSNAGWRILCVAIRKTWGWVDKKDPNPMGRKTWDEISYSQFREASGLSSSSSISKGIQECMDRNYLIRRQIGHAPGMGSPIFAYSLNVDYEVIGTVSVPMNSEDDFIGTVSVPIAPSIGTVSVPIAPSIGTLFGHTKVKGNAKLKNEEKKVKTSSNAKAEIKEQGQELWNQVLDELKLQMTSATFNQWLKNSRLIATDNDTWTVELGNKFALEWVDNRLRGTIERAVGRHAEGVEIEFVTKGE